MKPVIVSIGEVLWDLFPDGERFGGAPANFSCHAAIAGANVRLISSVGDDRHGRDAKAILDGYGIDTHQVRVVPHVSTGTVGIDIDSAGKPTFLIHQDSAWDQITFDVELESCIRDSDLVYFGTLAQRGEISHATIKRCVDFAGQAGIPRLLDINLRTPFYDDQLIRDSVAACSILKLSDDEFDSVASALDVSASAGQERVLCEILEQANLELIVMTRGEEGAILVRSDQVIHQAGFPTRVRDTVGAGDAFTATFALGLLGGKDHQTILRESCQRAAEICSIDGAVPPLSPRESE